MNILFSRKLSAGRPRRRRLQGVAMHEFAEKSWKNQQRLGIRRFLLYVKGEDPIRPISPRDRKAAIIDIRKVNQNKLRTLAVAAVCAEVCPMGPIDKVDFSHRHLHSNAAHIKKCPGAKY